MARVIVPKNQTIITAIPLAQRNADLTSDQFELSTPARGLWVFINVTASSTPAFTVLLRAVDPITNTAVGPSILTSVSIVGNGLTILRIHPELTAAANTIAKDMAPPVFEVFCDHTNANNATYSVAVAPVY